MLQLQGCAVPSIIRGGGVLRSNYKRMKFILGTGKQIVITGSGTPYATVGFIPGTALLCT